MNNIKKKDLTIVSVGKDVDVEQVELSYIASGKVNFTPQRLFGSFFIKLTYSYQVVQPFSF